MVTRFASLRRRAPPILPLISPIPVTVPLGPLGAGVETGQVVGPGAGCPRGVIALLGVAYGWLHGWAAGCVG